MFTAASVIEASDKAKATARKGGTPTLYRHPHPQRNEAGRNGTFKGQVFDPKRNIRAPATVRLLGSSNSFVVKGCVLSGIICKEQRWTRIS